MSAAVPFTTTAEARTGARLRRTRWVAFKTLGAVAVLWAAATFTFFVQTLLPGDRATLLLNQETGQQIKRTAAELAPINAKWGFHDPIFAQYWHYISGLLRGDLGISYRQKIPVSQIILEQVTPTIVLTITALVLAWVFALTLTLATAGRGKKVSAIGSAIETVAAAVPQYWLGVILLVVFAINLQWFPVEGGTSLAGLLLPALTLAIPLGGFLGQVTRDEFEKVLTQPFITTARARGMGDFEVRWRHALRHAVLPAITLSGWALGALFSGAVIAEIVFARQGIGHILVDSASFRDIPVVSGIVMLVAAIYVIANLLVDFAYSIVDPRINA